MYPIELESLLKNMEYVRKPILFFSCLSFEQRCKTASIKMHELLNSNILWKFFRLKDNGSYYEKDCLSLQNDIVSEIRELFSIENQDIPEYDLFDAQPWEEIISYYEKTIKDNPNIETVIIDITTIPKICYFKFLKWLLQEGLENRDLIICYTKPEEYGDSKLESDPIKPSLLIGNLERGKDILWIPSLGFKSAFTKIILENIRESDREVEKKIMPMIGFPAYRPDYFDKVLILHVKEGDKELKKSLENPILATADNPFDVYAQLIKIINNNRGKNIILSPLGPKPMSIGLALVAIRENLPVLTIQARTYHPDYSKGESLTTCYWIKRDGDYTF